MISLVIPILNEEELIQPLFERSIAAMKQVMEDFEIICVDDGSTDNSLSLLLKKHQEDKRFKVLSLSRNFGHQAAYTAGLEYAKGDQIAMMDGDLQDPPELLKAMHQKLMNDDCDIVYGKRKQRKESWTKRMLILLFHKIFKNISGIQKADNVGNFSIMSRRALTALLSLEERNRYLPGLRFLIGFKQEFVEYDREDRLKGKEKMGFSRLVKLALDAIFSFSDFPIKLCFFLGLTGVIVFFSAGVYSLVAKLIGIAQPGWSSTVLSVYFLGSIQLIFLGVIGEYVFRTYRESQKRPIYIVKDFYE